jgi:glutaredoxin
MINRKHTVTIYTSDSQFSNMTKDFFRERGCDFEEKHVLPDSDTEEYLRNKTDQKGGGILTLPIVEIDGRAVVGFRPDIFEIALREKPELAGEGE